VQEYCDYSDSLSTKGAVPDLHRLICVCSNQESKGSTPGDTYREPNKAFAIIQPTLSFLGYWLHGYRSHWHTNNYWKPAQVRG